MREADTKLRQYVGDPLAGNELDHHDLKVVENEAVEHRRQIENGRVELSLPGRDKHHGRNAGLDLELLCCVHACLHGSIPSVY